MQLILAIDSDPRRSEQLAALVRAARLRVDLVQATSAGEGLHNLQDRVPDLILTAPLLSPFDDGVLDEYLRDLGAAATHVQTLRIPMLSATTKKKTSARSLFSLGRKKKPTSSAAPDGCDPTVFADEIAHYLARSLEERTTSVAPAAGRAPQLERLAPVQQPAAADTLIEEFTEPIDTPPAPIYAAPAVEETYEPGAILHLRSMPVIAVPEPEIIVEPEPQAIVEPAVLAFVEPERPAFVEPEAPAFVEPELQAFVEPEPYVFVEPEPPAFVEPELQALVEPEPQVFVEPELPAIVEPVTVVVPKAASTPAAPATATGTSPSFEAALAAIRAAWVKPEAKKTVAVDPGTPAPQPPVSPSNAPVTGSPKPLAGSGEVDLTNEIDALEDVVGVDGHAPSADDEPSPNESNTPAERRPVDKSKKRPEKARGRKMRGPDGRDDWGVFDPTQYGFSALVNKLDEVTEDEVTERATTTVR
jgi:hypothetical protein